jgi:hypothetical protein
MLFVAVTDVCSESNDVKVINSPRNFGKQYHALPVAEETGPIP